MDPGNTHQKKFGPSIPTKKFCTHKYPRGKFWTDKVPTRKNFRPTKNPRGKILDPRNIHEKKFQTHEIPTKARWHDGIKPMRTTTTIARDPRNLAHSMLFMWMLKSKVIDRYSISSNIESRLVLTFFLPFHRIPK